MAGSAVLILVILLLVVGVGAAVLLMGSSGGSAGGFALNVDDEVTLEMKTTNTALCGSESTPAKIKATGVVEKTKEDGSSVMVRWNKLDTLEGRAGLDIAGQCKWARGDNAEWNKVWMGDGEFKPTGWALPVVLEYKDFKDRLKKSSAF
eukprot:tig00021728_g23296.t1